MDGHGLDSVVTMWGPVSSSTQAVSKAAPIQSMGV